jgi:hypothetical protein
MPLTYEEKRLKTYQLRACGAVAQAANAIALALACQEPLRPRADVTRLLGIIEAAATDLIFNEPPSQSRQGPTKKETKHVKPRKR